MNDETHRAMPESYARVLAAAPSPQEQIVTEGLMMTPNKVLLSCADAFEAGVRFAERQHGIVSSAVIAADRGEKQ